MCECVLSYKGACVPSNVRGVFMRCARGRVSRRLPQRFLLWKAVTCSVATVAPPTALH